MDVVREILVPAKLIRVGDYIPDGGWVDVVKYSRTGGLFPKRLVTVTFYTGEDIVDFTMESHIPVNVERIYDQVVI